MDTSKILQLKVKSVGNTNPSGRGMNGNVFDSDYLCPTLTTNKGEGIKILIKNAKRESAKKHGTYNNDR